MVVGPIRLLITPLIYLKLSACTTVLQRQGGWSLYAIGPHGVVKKNPNEKWILQMDVAISVKF